MEIQNEMGNACTTTDWEICGKTLCFQKVKTKKCNHHNTAFLPQKIYLGNIVNSQFPCTAAHITSYRIYRQLYVYNTVAPLL